jgi:hypothetical protein
MSLEDFKAAILAQGVPKEHFAFVCPMCGCIQSATSLINAGAGENYYQVEKYLAFSCVGRFTGAGSPPATKSADSKGCNWTLGGLFSLHRLVVVTPDGVKHPRFELASADEAAALMNRHVRATGVPA